MKSCDPTVMQKETIVKDDGRKLIYYRFVPETPSVPAGAAAPGQAEGPETPARQER